MNDPKVDTVDLNLCILLSIPHSLHIHRIGNKGLTLSEPAFFWVSREPGGGLI